MSTVETQAANLEQQRAVEERGVVFVSAGAGTGKTRVHRRALRAARSATTGSTSTRCSSSRTRSAPRASCAGGSAARLLELGRHDLARELDGAWISTIHGFCNRLLKAHPFAAGLDPRFRELDDSQGRVLRGEAFRAALDEFCSGDDEARLRLLATYGAAGCAGCSRASTRRFARPGSSSARPARGAAARRAARRARASTREPQATSGRIRYLETSHLPEELLDLSDLASPRAGRAAPRGRAGRARGARRARPGAAAGAPARASTPRIAAAKDRESALDFEDLQLLARDLLQRASGDPRARAAALPLDHGRRVPGHEPPPVRAHRPPRKRRLRDLLRRRRVPVDLRLPPRGRRGLPRAARGRRAECWR